MPLGVIQASLTRSSRSHHAEVGAPMCRATFCAQAAHPAWLAVVAVPLTSAHQVILFDSSHVGSQLMTVLDPGPR